MYEVASKHIAMEPQLQSRDGSEEALVSHQQLCGVAKPPMNECRYPGASFRMYEHLYWSSPVFQAP